MKFTNETPNLINCCETIRDITTRGGDWCYYDEQFRYIRQANPRQYPRDIVHWELWHRAVTFRANYSSFQSGKPNARYKGKQGWLRAYVGHSMRVVTAPGVVISTNGISVGGNTLGRNASLPQLGTTGEIERQQLHLKLNSPPVTPIRVSVLESLLSTYDLDFKNFLIDGFPLGFRIGFVGTSKPLLAPNLRSVEEQPEVLSAKLDKEWSAGRIVGPFSSPPFANFVSSPLGVVPKKTPGEFRIIHHLSYPDGSSVNDFIPSEKSTVHYASISDAIAMIKSIGRGSYMCKTDIKSAFRIIPIHPDDYHLLGMKWNNSHFFDRCLSMGCSSSCAIFEAFSTSMEWLAKHFLGASGVLHILDDFLFIAESESKCRPDLTKFLSLCDYLGVPIAHEKKLRVL